MKLKLDNEAITDDFFTDTRLLGIIAPIKNYQFCWQLNNLLGYRFRLNTDIDKQLHKKTRQYFFSVYQHTEDSFLNYYLYHNYCDGEYLLPDITCCHTGELPYPPTNNFLSVSYLPTISKLII